MKSTIFRMSQDKSLESIYKEKYAPIRKTSDGGIFVEYIHRHTSGKYCVKCVGFHANGILYVGSVTGWSGGKFFYQHIAGDVYEHIYIQVLESLKKISDKNTLIELECNRIKALLYSI